MHNINLEESLKEIHNLITRANEILEDNPALGNNGYDTPEELVHYYIKTSFIHTLTLLDRLELSRTYEQVYKLFEKAAKEGFINKNMGDQGFYLIWGEEIYTFLMSIANSYNVHPFSEIILSNVISILRSTLYSITDRKIFEQSPSSEKDVHERIEAVLRCIFPTLKNKPTITKPIKNFIPDTGLPSIRTLIEYKFISSVEDSKRVTDEVLADTRGYSGKDWDKFIFVIYETARIKPETEWNNMLSECGVPNNTKIIVLPGEMF